MNVSTRDEKPLNLGMKTNAAFAQKIYCAVTWIDNLVTNPAKQSRA